MSDDESKAQRDQDVCPRHAAGKYTGHELSSGGRGLWKDQAQHCEDGLPTDK